MSILNLGAGASVWVGPALVVVFLPVVGVVGLMWIFAVLFIVTMPAEFIANDRPLILRHDNKLYFPILATYRETEFGGEFDIAADYRDPYLQAVIVESGVREGKDVAECRFYGWDDYHAKDRWIKLQDSATVPARAPGGGKYQPIEDAPGSYVKMKD